MQTSTPPNFTLADGAGHTFFCESPRRRNVDQIVVSEPAAMPRCVKAAWILLSVMPGLAVVS
jgi:hypothetical protein